MFILKVKRKSLFVTCLNNISITGIEKQIYLKYIDTDLYLHIINAYTVLGPSIHYIIK